MNRFHLPNRVSARRGFSPAFGIILWLLLGGMQARADPPPKDSEWHWSLTVAGTALVAGGGALAYFQNQAADRDMAVYRNSAFTENTVTYRERVRTHEKWTWVGLGCAALGSVLIVVSF